MLILWGWMIHREPCAWTMLVTLHACFWPSRDCMHAASFAHPDLLATFIVPLGRKGKLFNSANIFFMCIREYLHWDITCTRTCSVCIFQHKLNTIPLDITIAIMYLRMSLYSVKIFHSQIIASMSSNCKISVWEIQSFGSWPVYLLYATWL